MSKATAALTTSTSRRALFGALPAVALAAGLPSVFPREAVAATAAEGDDAELLRLCDLFHQQQASLLAIPDTDDDAFEEAMDVRWEICMRPPITAGMMVGAGSQAARR